ncbi:C40 family peptidase [Frankia nepalensis]|uniref:C40 family peptidase n=1 Tax=Frankia nepalensis TaxID=1836974 RepID=UPI001EE47CAA|nr:C40 family peptidase [Frankia nepalensis]
MATSMTGFAAATSDVPDDGQPAADAITRASMLGNQRTPASEPADLALAAEVANPTQQFTSLTLTPDKTTISPNDQVTFTVHAAAAMTGAPVANEQVNIVVVTGSRWSTTATLRTDDAGEARISARLLSTTTVTAVFDGGTMLRPSVAGAATVVVRAPAASGTAEAGRGGAGSVTALPGSTIGAKAVYLASLQKGKPYVYGAAGPYAFDCSGFAQYIYKQLGRYLPRTAQQQFYATIRVPQSAKQPGDLIFFGTPDNITHMGIYAGNGYMWAAPRTGDYVKYQQIYTSDYYVGRVL